MRTRLLTSLLRTRKVAIPRRTRPISEHIPSGASRRKFTTSVPAFRAAMADMTPAQAAEEVSRLAQPAECEADILNKSKAHSSAVPPAETSKSEPAVAEEQKLPKLSAAEFRVYNSMAEHMEYFHNHFRQSWTMLYTACETNRRPANLSLKQFISTGIQFCSHLATHHGIEEQHIFPILATKMPEFKNGKNAAELLRQHKAIHAGMDEFEAYLQRCRSGGTELELRVLKSKMDSWGTVLWAHLDQEVKTLGAENMRKYWTPQEMKRMPM